MNQAPIKNFLELSYDELEKRNEEARGLTDNDEARATHIKYLSSEPRIKAVTVGFSDIEGRLHMLDYRKEYLLDSYDDLTFDGSSIHGFTEQSESDLYLSLDWTSLTYLPSDIFGAGKVMVFANVLKSDGVPHESDFRGRLAEYSAAILDKHGLTASMAPEIEGFLLSGVDAEQNFDQKTGFTLVSTGGYYHSLPLDELRRFIDRAAEAMHSMGFRNEKDHAEVAPSQFEINFTHTNALRACDQIQLYKVVCRQVATQMGMTASFLPKVRQNINGSGMHINMSLSKNGKNIFYDKNGQDNLSTVGWDFIDKILNRATDLCLLINSSVNSYRRLDPHFEAPNQIKVSARDRSAMVRVPMGNEKSARVEVRSVAPDANPYLSMYGLLKTGIDDIKPEAENNDKRTRLRFLPGTLDDSLRIFKASDYTTELLGEAAKTKYVECKAEVNRRSPKALGTLVKDNEILFHHEVTNQYIWNKF